MPSDTPATTVKGNARSSGYEKAVNSWYVEPATTVEALLDHEQFIGAIWDPACGAGNIPRVCESRGHTVHATDLIDRGYGMGGVDFLTMNGTGAYPNIICNPPFDLIEPFIHQALRFAAYKVAILGRLALLEGKGRRASIWTSAPFSRVWVCSSRISMPPGGQGIEPKGGSMAFAWFVFDKEMNPNNEPTIGFLP